MADSGKEILNNASLVNPILKIYAHAVALYKANEQEDKYLFKYVLVMCEAIGTSKREPDQIINQVSHQREKFFDENPDFKIPKEYTLIESMLVGIIFNIFTKEDKEILIKLGVEFVKHENAKYCDFLNSVFVALFTSMCIYGKSFDFSVSLLYLLNSLGQLVKYLMENRQTEYHHLSSEPSDCSLGLRNFAKSIGLYPPGFPGIDALNTPDAQNKYSEYIKRKESGIVPVLEFNFPPGYENFDIREKFHDDLKHEIELKMITVPLTIFIHSYYQKMKLDQFVLLTKNCTGSVWRIITSVWYLGVNGYELITEIIKTLDEK